MTRLRKGLLTFASILFVSCSALWATYKELSPGTPALAEWVPQGALLAIEANDFSSLLNDWSTSEQKRAWLSSDNYAEFSRSRLFSRLGEAQQQFAAAAGLPQNLNFLRQIAGRESLFAWYDIGNLEFVYVTHMPADTSARTQLLKERSRFDARKAGNDVFYVRSLGEPRRTVAFAVHGDYLLLATREDLLANALLLIQASGRSVGQISLRNEHWYASAATAAQASPGDLRMTLNLEAIVPSPYFRSYWVQQNVSEMKHYAVAITDLYRSPDSYREERVMLLKSPEKLAPAFDMAPLLQFLPASSGVYQASAHPSTNHVIEILQQKLLLRITAESNDNRIAPLADLSQQTVGTASDLETRIDVPALPQQPLSVALAPLRSVLDAAGVEAMLVASSTGDASGTSDPLFLPVRSVVALSASTQWNAETLESALNEVLRARLTTGDNGLRWLAREDSKFSWFELDGLQPLAFALRGRTCLLASDSDTLLRSLQSTGVAASYQRMATLTAGFNHSAESPRFARLTALLDQAAKTAPESLPDDHNNAGTQPNFFSGNIRSLSDTFQALDTETFVEEPEPDSHLLRQTVVYRWKH